MVPERDQKGSFFVAAWQGAVCHAGGRLSL